MIEIVPDYKNKWRTQETDVSEVLRTLEKLYNDFTARREEEKALDWAMNFIRQKTDKKDQLTSASIAGQTRSTGITTSPWKTTDTRERASYIAVHAGTAARR